jgi:hypothetical protein
MIRRDEATRMRIDAVDVYRWPLRFPWRTSCDGQTHTDTLLVRMEGGGHPRLGRELSRVRAELVR